MAVMRHRGSYLVIASALMLASCGDDSGDTSTATPTPTATATPTPTATATPTPTSSTSTNGVGTGVSQGTGTAAVVTAAEAFLATLSDTQKTETGTAGTTTTARFTLTRANAIQWTNLPGNRQGLRLNTSTLTTAQLTAAENLMATALSTAGKTEQDEIRRADDVLASSQSGYGSGLYSIAILGTPSTSSPWMLQIAGHHLAYNIMYNSTYVSGSPAFLGVEPPNWAVTSTGSVVVNGSVTASTAGTQHAPVETQRLAAYNLAQALQANSTFASGALLSGTYNDVVAGANGNTDSNFGSLSYPTANRGLLYTSLDSTTQALVKSLIEAYVNTQPSDKASQLLGVYESTSQLASTYVGYAKGAGGSADFGAFPSGVTSQRSYIRVDGPRVWIEFVVQQGVVYSSQVHYHSIWRDKVADYGGQFGNGSSNFSGT
ncbi:DUF3500 domain-containing protein [Sphingomonas sp. GC_Shp_1]|uniref:DUF3500 domain-containing protein n=1 Tax=Sphingomonas sp. GC_Shp_1 TaxID=2937385 RepID=UPI00226B3B57|nr:DUF3500 domain-containing protein [Sphingomonas sp. GC_Shp_1]